MGELSDALATDVKDMFRDKWTSRDGELVPAPESLRLGNDAIKLDCVTLYADMAESTKLVQEHQWWFAAECYKTFLHCASRIIKDAGGQIVSFDGDRVMAVFVGNYKNTSAVIAALKINGARSNIINPAMKAHYGDRTSYSGVDHCVGIASGEVRAARIGVRGDNDIVWVGRAANMAAKLCDLRHGSRKTWITETVFNRLNKEAKYGGSPNELMWERHTWNPYDVTVYSSGWTWYPF